MNLLYQLKKLIKFKIWLINKTTSVNFQNVLLIKKCKSLKLCKNKNKIKIKYKIKLKNEIESF